MPEPTARPDRKPQWGVCTIRLSLSTCTGNHGRYREITLPTRAQSHWICGKALPCPDHPQPVAGPPEADRA